MGRGSSVGIANRYRLDGPEIESRWGVRFSTPVQTGPGIHPAPCTTGVPGLFLGEGGGLKRSGRGVDPYPHLEPRLRKEWSYASTPLGLHVLY